MPVFGNRMVVGTANYKHIEKVKKETEDRETKLASWMREKEERKENLKKLHDRIRQSSLYSNDSRLPTGEISSSRRGSSVQSSRRSSAVSSRRESAVRVPESGAERRPSNGTILSNGIAVSDTTQIVGGGRKKETSCANCCIQ